MKAHIDVFARIKPFGGRYAEMPYKLDENKRQLAIQIPKNIKLGHVNNTKEFMEFRYTKIYDQAASQEEVFDGVAKPVIMNCLDGYNGTIFAYGQTGSGKTYTMSGAETWQLRGVIPRVLSFLFDEFERRNDIEYNMYISFMEIYNEVAYDLLDRRHIEMTLESWNKVMLMEDDYGNIHLKNLSVHQCYSEQDGIDLLMMGNFIRQVSSTPMNQSSSRSHAIFTITLEGKHINSETYFVSKLHLVDLAGSERISKSNVEGSLLTEAKHINLSLTYLEQVIIALHEKSLGNRSHIPYRNSLMTTILRDSLGGNCKTVMIANLSSDVDNLDETISTSRFAQRCSLLVNEIKKNERIDMNMLVRKLEVENVQLREELEFYRQNQGKAPTGKGKGEPAEKPEKPQNGKKSQANTEISTKKEEPKQLTQFEYFEISANVESYLNDKLDAIHLKNLTEADAYMKCMKDFYCSRMREYIGELNVISSKLKKYEEILAKRRSHNASKNQSSNSLDLYAEEEALSYDPYAELPHQGMNQHNEGYQNGYSYERGSRDNDYDYQNQKKNANVSDKKLGFYNFGKAYKTEAIIEAPDEGDY